jgi:hypothetical protein
MVEQTCIAANAATLSPKTKTVKIDDQIMSTLTQDSARTYCSMYSVGYEDKLGEQLHPIGF